MALSYSKRIAQYARDLVRVVYSEKMRAAVALLLAFACAAFAQDADKTRDALEWTVALRGRMAQMANPVVRVHGIASVARVVCPVDPVTASGLYQDAITSLFNVPSSAFGERGTTVLPVASFSGLWKYVVPAALKCDPDLASAAKNQQARERLDAERAAANSTLSRAYGLLSSSLDKADMLDRAAQVAAGALEAGDPDTFDTGPAEQLSLSPERPSPGARRRSVSTLARFRPVGSHTQPGQSARSGEVPAYRIRPGQSVR